MSFSTVVLCGLLIASSFAPSFLSWALLYIFAYGIGNGVSYISPVQNSWLWFPDRPGLASGIVLSGFGLSALIFNNIALIIVNPNNEIPVDGRFPSDVNDRVPFMIQVMSAIYLGMAVISIIFV